MSDQRVLLSTPADSRRLRVVGDSVRVLATSNHTGRQFELFEFTGPRESGPPPHAHPWTEAYLISDGKLKVLVENDWRTLGPGDFVLIPPETVHAYKIASEQARFLVITGGGNASALFEGLNEVTDFGRILDVALTNGLTIPAPPA